MDRSCRKAINFDLDTKQLKKEYPLGEQNYRRAYADLEHFFEKNGFEHRQGSGYQSKDDLVHRDVFSLIEDVQKAFPWLGRCVKRIDVTDIGNMYDLTHLFSQEDGIAFEPRGGKETQSPSKRNRVRCDDLEL